MAYTRKYAGPLQPWRKSAYVKGTRKRTLKSSKKPSRLRKSTARYSLNKAISKQINNMTENKFQGYVGDCLKPQQKPSGNQPISYMFYNTGETLTQAANAPFNSMDLFSFPKGDDNDQRNGDYMYIKKTHLKMELQMLPQAIDDVRALNSTTQFRVMIVKANRALNKLGKSPTPGNSLFINTQNDPFGFGITGTPSNSSVFLNFEQPINKRQWLVYKDMKFTLSPPAQESVDNSATPQFAYNTANSKYPVKKFISCNLPFWKKTHFDDENVPDNVDTQFLIIVQAVRTNYCSDDVKAPDNYRLNMCATTSASDN